MLIRCSTENTIATITSHIILVRKEVFDDLLKNYPNLNGLPHAQEEYLVFNENEILNHHSKMDYNQKKESILLLRRNSELPIQNVTVEDDDFHEMIRDFQQALI